MPASPTRLRTRPSPLVRSAHARRRSGTAHTDPDAHLEVLGNASSTADRHGLIAVVRRRTDTKGQRLAGIDVGDHRQCGRGRDARVRVARDLVDLVVDRADGIAQLPHVDRIGRGHARRYVGEAPLVALGAHRNRVVFVRDGPRSQRDGVVAGRLCAGSERDGIVAGRRRVCTHRHRGVPRGLGVIADRHGPRVAGARAEADHGGVRCLCLRVRTERRRAVAVGLSAHAGSRRVYARGGRARRGIDAVDSLAGGALRLHGAVGVPAARHRAGECSALRVDGLHHLCKRHNRRHGCRKRTQAGRERRIARRHRTVAAGHVVDGGG